VADTGRLEGGGDRIEEMVGGETDNDALLARLTLLADASSVLTETLDPDTALYRLARLVVPVLGDWCGVHVMDEAGGVRTAAAAAHRDPVGTAWVDSDLDLDASPGLASTSPVAAVLKGGEPRLFRAVTDELLATSAASSEQLEIFRAMDMKSAVVVPLRGRARVLGALTVVSAESGRRLDDAGLAVAIDLGRKAGLALENAQLYQRARNVAKAFEQVLVPERLAQVPGLDVAARYLPATGTDVGGDWYDVIPFSDGRVGLVIGDVIGHDLRASSIMASLRTAVRAYAWMGSRPAEVVNYVDELARGLEADHMATLIYSIYEPTTRRLCWSNAGHLPPLILGPGPTATYLEEPSSVLVGAMGGLSYSEGEIELGPDSTVLFYTDGLIQERGGLVSEGLDRLGQLAAAQSHADPRQLINMVLAYILGEDQRADDIALLCVRVKH
jgi:serine phosphatase RsbU (regulator of sigma subunit)